MSAYTENQLSMEYEDEHEPEETHEQESRRTRKIIQVAVSLGVVILSLMTAVLLAGPNLKAGADQFQSANDWILVRASEGTDDVVKYGSYSKMWQIVRDNQSMNDTITLMNASGYGGTVCEPTYSLNTVSTHYVCSAITMAGFGKATIRLYIDDELPNEPGGFGAHLVVRPYDESELNRP